MSSRREFVQLASVEGANVRELARRFGISPTTAYKWLARYEASGVEGLVEVSRVPRTSPGRTSPKIEAAVIEWRQRHPAWGGRKLQACLRRAGHTEVPSASTITQILRRAQLLASPVRPTHAIQSFEHPVPNALWQMDFKGHIAIGSGRCHPLTILDDHSRYSLGLFACADEKNPTVRGHLVSVFRRFGLPERILCDNGPPWGASESPYTELGVWLLRLGVRITHGRAYHPQTQGKDERFHRTLNIEVLQGQTFRDLGHCQRRFDDWREVYNAERPHEALAMNVPASRYQVSPRSYPETLPPLEYHAHDAVRKVQLDGKIYFQNREWKVGQGFAKQRVAVRPRSEDGQFDVYFATIPVAQINLHDDNTPA